MSNLGHDLKLATSLLDAMYWQHNAPLVYVAYSGGRDSACVLDIAARWGESRNVNVRAMAIDTGLAADGWRDMVTRHCESVSVPLDICTGKGFDWYMNNVREYGFGYTPGAHVYYYRALKQDAIQSHLQQVKRHYHDRVLYLTGVRRSESVKRRDAKWYVRHGARVTVAPIAHFSGLQVNNYVYRLCPWWRNDYYVTLGNSGDCQCGWTCRNSLSDLAPYPVLQEKIRACESVSVNRYGERMDTKQDVTETMPDDSFCLNCYQPTLL